MLQLCLIPARFCDSIHQLPRVVCCKDKGPIQPWRSALIRMIPTFRQQWNIAPRPAKSAACGLVLRLRICSDSCKLPERLHKNILILFFTYEFLNFEIKTDSPTECNVFSACCRKFRRTRVTRMQKAQFVGNVTPTF